MNQHAIRRFAAISILALPAMLFAQQPVPAPTQETSKDMISRIFTGEFSEHFSPAPSWFNGGQSYITMEPTAGGHGSDLVKYDTATGMNREVLITAAQLTPEGAKEPLRIAELSWSKDNQRLLVFTNTRRVWRTDSRGDYWFVDRTNGKLKKLGGDAPEASLMYAKFNPDATKVAYVKKNDIFVEDLASGLIQRITNDGSDLVINGGSDWVNEEELDLHDCFRWSQDGKRIAFWQFDLHGVGDFALMYYLGKERQVVTNIPYPQTGPYPTEMQVPYPLAGTTNSSVRVGVVNADGKGSVKWMDVVGDPRQNYIARMQWADAKTLLIQQLNRLQNTDIYLLADATSGATHQMWRDHDAAFISIGFGGLPEAQPIHDGRQFLALSEKDGWMHVWAVDRSGHETLVTRGAMDATGIEGIDEKGGWLYFIASPDNATQRYLYRSPLDGAADPVRVTQGNFAGVHSYNISPDGKYAYHSFSSINDPGLRELVSLPDHKIIRPSSDSTEYKKRIAQFLTPPVEFFKADAGDGVSVDGWMIKPPNFDRSKKYPVLVNIYGEPAAQTALDRWSGNGILFHRYIASLGYLVVTFDNSGTPAPRGRAWRKAIYGDVGVLSSKQQTQALRSLGKMDDFVDLNRVAVWGWSGGGTNTLNLMFRSPDLYKVGMAVAPVPDQRLYDSIYQERYMGLPQDNVDGYKQGSAINFAAGLKGHLLIVHGSGDDNVHYQGTELLVNRLIEFGKPFDLMTYPDRTHGIFEGPGTTVHLYHLLARYLTEHLPAGPQ
ncbi:MAG TPA: DPP IV N-terminal domain-containing protein [Candidatus Angelobacter sp.]|nr:DPP IV N-terminal domain-containing protein [Candidatus Angelobacter sp.]